MNDRVTVSSHVNNIVEFHYHSVIVRAIFIDDLAYANRSNLRNGSQGFLQTREQLFDGFGRNIGFVSHRLYVEMGGRPEGSATPGTDSAPASDGPRLVGFNAPLTPLGRSNFFAIVLSRSGEAPSAKIDCGINWIAFRRSIQSPPGELFSATAATPPLSSRLYFPSERVVMRVLHNTTSPPSSMYPVNFSPRNMAEVIMPKKGIR